MADMKKTYYLLEGRSISKAGLPGGKLSAKKEPLKIEPKYLKVIEKNIDYFVTQGVIVDNDGLEKEKSKPSKKAEFTKKAPESNEPKLDLGDK